MKVAYLLGSLNRGGTEVLLLDLLRNIQKSNFDAIVVHRKMGHLHPDFLSLVVSLYHLFPKTKIDVKYFYRLRKLLLDEKVDIIHAQQPLDAFFARIAGRGTKIKVVLTIHGFDFNFSTLSRIITKFIIRRTDKNIYVSNTQKEYYMKEYSLQEKAKNLVVFNGVSFEKFNDINSTLLKNELDIPENYKLFACIGNFNVGRNQLLVCKFIKLLDAKISDYKFLFIGKKDNSEPWRYDNCVKYCEDNELNNVMFLGSRNDVPNILSQIDAFVYASEHDTFGIVVIEAIAMGVPVFVNNWEVMLEITKRGEYASIYETNNEKDLFIKFMNYMSNSQLYKQKAIEASKNVKGKFSIESNILQLENIYTCLVN